MTEYEKINRRFENLFFGRINKALKSKINAFIEVLERGGNGKAFLENNLTNAELTKEVQRLYETVGLRHANRTTRDLKRQERKGFGFNEEWVKFIQEYLREHLTSKILFGVNETQRDYLIKVLQRSVEEGLGVDETVRNLRSSGFTDRQAATITRTEVNTASNVGVLAAGDTYEYQMQKEWVSVKDNRTRGKDPEDHASHVALNGTVIDFEDMFTDPRNGDRLNAPGDPKASAASIINCRCNLTLKPKRDSRGKLIPKRQSTVVIYPNPNRTRTVLI